MKTIFVAAFFATGLCVLGCSDPTAGKPKAETSAPVTEVKEAPLADKKPTVGSLSFALNGSNTTVGYVGSKVTGSHEGNFGVLVGNLEVQPNDPESTKLDVEIEMASVTSDNEKLTAHLKSADFFEVSKFPKANFKVTSVKASGVDGATHTVTGNLTLKGTTKSISFPATVALMGKNITMKAEFLINRKDFGIVYPGMPDDLIKDNVLLKLALNATAN